MSIFRVGTLRDFSLKVIEVSEVAEADRFPTFLPSKEFPEVYCMHASPTVKIKYGNSLIWGKEAKKDASKKKTDFVLPEKMSEEVRHGTKSNFPLKYRLLNLQEAELLNKSF